MTFLYPVDHCRWCCVALMDDPLHDLEYCYHLKYEELNKRTAPSGGMNIAMNDSVEKLKQRIRDLEYDVEKLTAERDRYLILASKALKEQGWQQIDSEMLGKVDQSRQNR